MWRILVLLYRKCRLTEVKCPIKVVCDIYKNFSPVLPVPKVVVCVRLANSRRTLSHRVEGSAHTDAVSSWCVECWWLRFCCMLLRPWQAVGQHVGRLSRNAAKPQHLTSVKLSIVYHDAKISFLSGSHQANVPSFEYKLLSKCITSHLSILNLICPSVSQSFCFI